MAATMRVEISAYSPHFRGEWHEHQQAQLIYPKRGTMTIHTNAGTWVVPPLRACWLPPREPHCVETSNRLEMHSVYCEDLTLAQLPQQAGIVEVSALMRELILAMHGAPAVDHMALVLADQIRLQRSQRLIVPTVRSWQLKRIANALGTDPADQRTLRDWSEELGISTRTLARLFEKEIRVTFKEYRLQVRLHAALARLSQGQAVSAIAYDLGFSSASNFIAMFRKATGTTPKRYLRIS